jgi:peptide-methionine (S)-S-oxide reductase
MRSHLALVFVLASALAPAGARAASDTAIFAGGCFWCVEADFDKVKGVSDTTSGYAGGTLQNPTYHNHHGYQESVKVTFDPAVVSYDTLVRRFIHATDVVDAGGQFCDRGDEYATSIFTANDEQKRLAEAALADAGKELGQKVATQIRPVTTFTAAEDYHQNYHTGQNRVLTRFGYVKQEEAYNGYREGCGRDARVKELWGKTAYTDGKVTN